MAARPPTSRRRSRCAAPSRTGLHQLDAFNLAIALKHAIYDAGFTCRRVTDGGFVAEYENLDMWTATLRRRAAMGDFRRPRRQRPGARLQGCRGKRASRAARSRASPRAISATRLRNAPYLGSHSRVSRYSPLAVFSLTVVHDPWRITSRQLPSDWSRGCPWAPGGRP